MHKSLPYIIALTLCIWLWALWPANAGMSVVPVSVAISGNPNENLAQVGGNATVTVANGVPRVGIADSSNNAIVVGQTTMASSLPVVIASNQSAVPASQSGTWTVTANTAAAATGGYSFNHQSANTAGVTVKSGAGTLHTLILNNIGATDTITLYDNTAASGTVIAVINDAAGQGTYTFDCAFSTGLEIVIAGTTAPDVTVTYK